MILKTSMSNGKPYLSVVKGFRDPITKKVKQKTVKSFGYVHELEKLFPDPVAHFKQVVADMNAKEKADLPPVEITIDRAENISFDQNNRKNIGYAALSQIYHELELDIFLNNRSRNLKAEYNVNAIMRLLTFSRILFPASKKHTYETRGRFFENFNLSLDDIYRCLSFLNTIRQDIQFHLHKSISSRYERTTEYVYYDVTNYYFEIDETDRLRKKGVSKEHRPDPIVQMGLFIDADGIPMAYGLYPGNTNDCETLLPLLDEMKRNYDIGRIVIVADKGMNTGSNIAYNVIKGDGYVYAQTVRGANKEFKDYVLNQTGYRWTSDHYKIKSRIYPREIMVTDVNNRKKRVPVDEKQVIFYSRDYDKKAKADRAAAVQKAYDLVSHPDRYNRATSYGAAKYVKNLEFDKKTGEILTVSKKPVFDAAKLHEEELYDGYYAIVTSEYKKTDEEIIDIYRGLWEIEESFKITKSDFDTRPVFLSREDRIEAHFLICFVALIIARLLQKRLDNDFSIAAIVQCLAQSSGTLLEQDWYVFDYVDAVTLALKERMGIDLTQKYLRAGDMKKIIAASKKHGQ